MLLFPLALKSFEIEAQIGLEEMLNNNDEGDTGHFVRADLDYLDQLYGKHSDFPLISNKEPLDLVQLSEYQSELNFL